MGLLTFGALTVSCNAVASGVELSDWNELCEAAVVEADDQLGGGGSDSAKRQAWTQCMQEQGAECVTNNDESTYRCRSTTGGSNASMEAPF